jgi:plastocyanin
MQQRRSVLALAALVMLVAFVAGCASTAAGMAFDTSTITVSAGTRVTITFVNNDGGVPHNIAFYTSPSATTVIYKGARTTGVSTVTYTFDAPTTPGTYFFRCDVHPSTMTGEFIVT